MAPQKGWKTKRQWASTLTMAVRTLEKRLAVLIENDLAKKKKMKSEGGNFQTYYWINNLSDEDQG